MTGILVPLPTIIEDVERGRRCRSIPLDDDMCEEAPVSRIQGGCALHGHLLQGHNQAGLVLALTGRGDLDR